MMKELQTASEVIEALGGHRATSILTRRKGTAVYNWGYNNKLPPDTYFAIIDPLNAKGMTAPKTLWGMVEPETPPREKVGG